MTMTSHHSHHTSGDIETCGCTECTRGRQCRGEVIADLQKHAIYIHSQGTLVRVTAIYTSATESNAHLRGHGGEGVIAAGDRLVFIADNKDLGACAPRIQERA